MKRQLSIDDRVGIFLSRSDYLIISLLGVMKAGITYIPIDPNLPQERISYIVRDSGIKTLITHSEYKNVLKILKVGKYIWMRK